MSNISKIKYKGTEEEKMKKAKQDQETLDWLERMETNREKTVAEDFAADLKEKQKELDKSLDTADFYIKRANYDFKVAELGRDMIDKLELSSSFKVACTPTRKGTSIKIFDNHISGKNLKDGIVVVMKYGDTFFYRAFWLVRVAEVDLGALRTVITQLENTVDSLTGKLESDKDRVSRETGLILPK
jgi:hypothetical protein